MARFSIVSLMRTNNYGDLGGFMKRWQNKKQKLMLGGLLLLLMASSVPWNHSLDIELGSANLSALARPKGFNIKDFKEDFVPLKKTRLTTAKKKVIPTDDEDLDQESSVIGEETLKRNIKIGRKNLKATYEKSAKDSARTLVTLATQDDTEAQGSCAYCGTFEIDRPLKRNLDTIQLMNEDIRKYFATKDKKIKARTVEVADGDDEDYVKILHHKLSKVDSDLSDLEDKEDDIDPIKEKCKSITSKDRYTLCAMNKLALLANIRGDKAYDSTQLKELFEKHIFRNLKNQLEDRVDSIRRDDAKINLVNLIEKLDEKNSNGLRSVLTKMEIIPHKIEAMEIANLKHEADLISKTNPSRALVLLNEFNWRRANFLQSINADIIDSADAYENLVSDDFSRPSAMNQFYENFMNPLSPMTSALFSEDPYTTLRGLQQNSNIDSPGQTNFAFRSARDQMGRNSNTTFNQSRSNFPTRGSSSRSFPSGPGYDSRFANNGQNGNIGQNGFPQSFNNGNGGFNNAGLQNSGFNNIGLQSRFGSPVTNPNFAYNAGPGYRGYGPQNAMVPNAQPFANRFPQQGYVGNGPGMGAPVLNGANYYPGYVNPQGNPFAYRPTNGGFVYQTNFNQNMSYGPQGMNQGINGGARPRF